MRLEYAYDHDALVANFVSLLIPQTRERGFSRAARAIGVVSNGELVAGIVYHNWDPHASIIEMSVGALPGCRWLTRETIRRMFEYPFQQLGCQMVFNLMDENNEQLLRQCAALGFAFIRLPRLMGRDHDAVYGFLTDDEWRANKIHRRAKVDVPEIFREAA